MKSRKKEFTLVECVMVVTILLSVAGLAIRDFVRSVRTSEVNTIHTAAKEYSAVRNMYAAQYRAAPAGASSEQSAGGASVFSTTVR